MKFFGVYAKNRQELYLCDIAAIIFGITVVPFYDTLGTENLTFTLNHTNLITCMCG
jgi:long-chain acyl-CoA synthetase